MMTANQPVNAEYFPVLVRADIYEWIEQQTGQFAQEPAPAMMDDITHCPACAHDVESLWLSKLQLDLAEKNEALGLTPMCDRCREDGEPSP